jgi:hypothetical protein
MVQVNEAKVVPAKVQPLKSTVLAGVKPALVDGT